MASQGANLSIGALIGTIFFAIIGIIMVVAVGIPIIDDYQVEETVANAGAINSIINIIPIMLILIILIGVAYAVMSYVRK